MPKKQAKKKKKQLSDPKQTNNEGFTYRKKIRPIHFQWRRKYVVG